MNGISIGTPCFLVNIEQMPGLLGRVVEVVGIATVSDDGGDWYSVTAEWALQMFPGRALQAPRRNLLPLTPPGLAPHAVQKRIPVPEKV